jgi:hypothetical protein
MIYLELSTFYLNYKHKGSFTCAILQCVFDFQNAPDCDFVGAFTEIILGEVS